MSTTQLNRANAVAQVAQGADIVLRFGFQKLSETFSGIKLLISSGEGWLWGEPLVRSLVLHPSGSKWERRVSS
jgi:hypothetical protein